MTHLRTSWRRALKSRRFLVGAVVFSLLLLAAIFADQLAAVAGLFSPGAVRPHFFPHRGELPFAFETDQLLRGPSAAHLLGTDERGRDVLVRLVFGTRSAIGLGLLVVMASLLVGTILGGAAGFVSRAWDRRLERIAQTIDTFPVLLVVALVRVIQGSSGPISLAIALSVARAAELARVVRTEVLRASSEDYVLAARAAGSSRTRVFFRHILPNTVGPILVSSVFGVGTVALLESALSFLELGEPSSFASWGEMLAEGARHPSWTLIAPPLGLLFLAVLSIYAIGDGLRDAMDPRGVHRGRLAITPGAAR